MSISEFFNKRSRAVVAATALALGGAGGYAGYQAAENYQKPQLSEFTLSHAPQDMTEQQFLAGRLPAGAVADKDESAARRSFTQQIDIMEAEERQYWELMGPIEQARILPSLPMGEMEARATHLHASLVDHAVSFVSDLRESENLSGKDYQALLDDYNARVGLDVTVLAGNYKKGVAFTQECQIAGARGHVFSGFGHNDATSELRSDDIGACMQEVQTSHDQLALEGAAAGAVLGGLFVLPLWLRRRNAMSPGHTPPARGAAGLHPGA